MYIIFINTKYGKTHNFFSSGIHMVDDYRLIMLIILWRLFSKCHPFKYEGLQRSTDIQGVPENLQLILAGL